MKGTGTPPRPCGQPYARPALVLALLMLLQVAGCKHPPATQSQSSAKDEHSQQPARAAAPAVAAAPSSSLPEEPRFAVQVAAFDRRASAEALAARLSEQYGLQALVAPVEANGETLYRVRLLVGDKNQAESVANTFLRTEKLKVWIVALP